jgi:hypothetical protein
VANAIEYNRPKKATRFFRHLGNGAVMVWQSAALALALMATPPQSDALHHVQVQRPQQQSPQMAIGQRCRAAGFACLLPKPDLVGRPCTCFSPRGAVSGTVTQ